MTLRTKTLLIVGLTLLTLFVVLFFTLSNILETGFTRVENQFVIRNVTRAVEALSDDINKVNTTVGDWAPWDDTYNFVTDGNEDYIDDNLTTSTFTNLGINVMLFVDEDGNVAYGQGFDLISGEFAPVQDSLEAEIGSNDLLLSLETTTSNLVGVVLLPDNPMLVASQPILTSDREGPINGTLLMGRYLDAEQIADLEARTQFEITIESLDGESLPSAFETALAALSQSDADEVQITSLSEERIAGYTIVNDIYGQPGLLLRVDMARDVFAQGQVTRNLFIYSLAGAGAVFLLVTLIIIERIVLSRLFRLSDGVAEIGAGGDLSMRLSLPGSDELGQLAATINKMLQDLQESLAREKELKAEVKRLRIQVDLAKQTKAVSEIVDTDYFQDLQRKAREIRASKPKAESKSKKKKK